MPWFVIAAFLFILFILLLVYRDHVDRVYFESRGVTYLGNASYRTFANYARRRRIGLWEDLNNQYKKIRAKNAKVAGSNDFGSYAIFFTDPELLKTIFIKDFDYFTDRRPVPKSADSLLSKMLITRTGERWKVLRSKLSPTFTTGKIKRLFPLFDESANKFMRYLELEAKREECLEDGINLIEGYSKYTMDIIASAACGFDSKAFEQRGPGVFEQMGKKLQFDFGFWKVLRMIFIMTFPWFAKWMSMGFIDGEVEDFFNHAIKRSIKQRIENNEKREDFIQLMLEARGGKLKTDEGELETFEKDAQLHVVQQDENANILLDDDTIVANCVLFILAGFDTTQSALLYCAYALALNPEVQDALRKEVEETLDNAGGQFTYDALGNMTYLDKVINETLRLYPPAGFTDRQCTQDYKIPGTDFILKKGEGIAVPIYGLHRDPEYFPNPEKFDPERFSPENKAKTLKNFMPFGTGPRNCIGMRFALTEVKLAICHLVHNFRIEPSKKTLIPMKFSQSVSLKPDGGMFLSLTKIMHEE